MNTIRELADSCNISVRTLQYYDQIDLLKPSGYQGRIRLYDEAAKEKLKGILAWKVLGLSLEEIIKLQQGAMDQMILLEQKKEQLMMAKDVLLKNQMQVDDILYHIRQSKEWNPGDYTEVLSLQTMDRPYSLTTHLVALLRNMTLLKMIILIFYMLDALCIAALVAKCATLLIP